MPKRVKKRTAASVVDVLHFEPPEEAAEVLHDHGHLLLRRAYERDDEVTDAIADTIYPPGEYDHAEVQRRNRAVLASNLKISTWIKKGCPL